MKMLHRRFPNLFRINKICNRLILEVFKDLDTPLIATCKKVGVDGKPNKKCNKSSKDDSFTLALAFCQFEESSNKIETMKIECTHKWQKKQRKCKTPLPKRHGDGRASNLKYFIGSTSNDNNFCKCVKI